MTDRGRIGLAVLLTAVAGWVDAVGYLELGRLFVSFMSGNSTLLAIGLAGVDRTAIAGAALSVALYVAGAFLGTLLGDAAGERWRVPAVLGVEALLLGAVALLPAGAGRLSPAVVPLLLAMGFQTAGPPPAGGIKVGLTYVTGTLASLGRHLARAASGRGGRWAWLPYALLWVGLVAGATAGAAADASLGLASLAAPAACVAAVASLSAVASARTSSGGSNGLGTRGAPPSTGSRRSSAS